MHMHFKATVWVCICLSCIHRTQAAGPVRPVLDTPEGRRAFDDLAAYYADRDKRPQIGQYVDQLEDANPTARAAAGRYLCALFRQMLADESNGRADWHAVPYWGAEPECSAREFRKSAASDVGDVASGPEALDLAQWLIENDELPDSNRAGIRILRRTQHPLVIPILGRILAHPHPNQHVTTGAITEVGARNLVQFAPDVRCLCRHYRTAVRTAARTAASRLGISDLPPYDPAQAFTPWLDAQLRTMTDLVMPPIPKDAVWTRFTRASDAKGPGALRQSVFSAWLIERRGGDIVIVNRFGDSTRVKDAGLRTEPRAMARDIDELLAVRKKLATDRHADGVLSRSGTLSRQFEPRFISIPEALLAAWAFERGDRASAARLLFPRIDEAEDERWLLPSVRDMTGSLYFHELLEEFCGRRDYVETSKIAAHLLKPGFDGYEYQPQIRELLSQLPRRSADYHELRLPSPDEWSRLKSALDRRGQIEYLSARLRLLNCWQWGQPGNVDYKDDQCSETFEVRFRRRDELACTRLINPYVELLGMGLAVGELPALIPRLTDDDFMLTFSYWRSFHPDRTLHRVRWAVASIVNATAARDIVQFDQLMSLDPDSRKRHLDRITDWCKAHTAKDREQLLLDTLQHTASQREFRRVGNEAARLRLPAAVPVLIRREKDFDSCRDDVAQWCCLIGGDAATAQATRGLGDSDKAVRFWSAATLLRAGPPEVAKAIVALKPIVEDKDDDYAQVASVILNNLCVSNDSNATELACQILRRQLCYPEELIRRLLATGNPRILECLLSILENDGDGNGPRDRPFGADDADRLAATLRTFHVGSKMSNPHGPESNPTGERDELRKWLRRQIDLAKRGEKIEWRNAAAATQPHEQPEVFEWRIDD